jgi:outer membrane protein TolC
MRRAWGLGLVLLVLRAGWAQAPDLAALLQFVEEHNHRLRAQRAVLAALEAEPPGRTDVLRVLEAEQHSLWKHVRLTSGVGARVSPGDEGSGLDTRIGVQLSVPLADYSGRLALARERQQQHDTQQARQQQRAAARLAYATLRDQLFAEVVGHFGTLEALAATVAATQAQHAARVAQQALIQQRVEVGAEGREKLWQVQDQVHELARQLATQHTKLQQTRTALALYGGDAWKTVLGWLAATRSWLPSPAK